MDTEEKKIPTVEEMKEKALKIGKSIPNIEKKYPQMIQLRGHVIEFSINIEKVFIKLITETGKEMVIDHKKKEFHVIAGARNKNDLGGLRSIQKKGKEVGKLIEKSLIEPEKISISDLLKDFDRFAAIRDIFAHVPVNWYSNELEFSNESPYEHLFKLDSKWKDVSIAFSEFMGLYEYITNAILIYGRQIQLKKELISKILFGPDLKNFQKEVDKIKGEEEQTE